MQTGNLMTSGHLATLAAQTMGSAATAAGHPVTWKPGNLEPHNEKTQKQQI